MKAKHKCLLSPKKDLSKRNDAEAYTVQNAGGKGSKNFKILNKTGDEVTR